MDNLPIKRQPLVGECVRERGNTTATGTVFLSDHMGVGVRYSDTRLTYYSRKYLQLEVARVPDTEDTEGGGA